MRFCPECGGALAAAVGSLSSPSSLDAGNKDARTEFGDHKSGVGHLNRIASENQKNIVAGNQTFTTTVVNQDETKAVRTCSVSGRQAEVTKGNVCPACGLWVHSDYFNTTLLKCSKCQDASVKHASGEFAAKVQFFLADGKISPEELDELRKLGSRLGLSLAVQDSLISRERDALLKTA